jgi:hypothetical protein
MTSNDLPDVTAIHRIDNGRAVTGSAIEVELAAGEGMRVTGPLITCCCVRHTPAVAKFFSMTAKDLRKMHT